MTLRPDILRGIRKKISTDPVTAIYGSIRLADRLIESLQEVGYDLSRLSAADLMTFDELHVMGRQATLSLGRLSGLTDSMCVLDIGSGLGGSARTLAAEFGCHVNGVDLSAEFVAAALVLSERVGLSDRVDFRYGDALNMPYEENQFDAAFMIHVTMNIADKKGLFAEAWRVLKPAGKLVLWEIFKTAETSLTYPVPWAENESFSFLIPMAEMVSLIRATGFSPLQVDDATAEAAEWVRACMAPKRDMRPRAPRPNLDLVLDNFRLKRTNLSKNLLQGAIGVLRVIAVKNNG